MRKIKKIKITQEQYIDLEIARFLCESDYHKLLEELTGIIAIPYSAFYYVDRAGSYIGNSSKNHPRDLLKSAHVEVMTDG